ncbi:MAG: hypothetical protein KGQ58_08095 [Proteobacteria bacterium]|nr:hypothetical protein [Pseudomonadota bacterium]
MHQAINRLILISTRTILEDTITNINGKRNIIKILVLGLLLIESIADCLASRLPTHFSSRHAAQSSCPKDIVVWANTYTHQFYYEGSRGYTHKRNGSFMCKKQAIKQGWQVAPHIPFMY